jgi:imidazolonepropionase-like amidohydrolase
MTASSSVVLLAPWLLDGTGAAAISDAALWLDDGRIAWVGAARELPEAARGVERIELQGCTLLPGLVDVHVHLVASGGPDLAGGIPASESGRTLAAVANARRHLDAGVTLVRDLGATGGEAIAVGRAVEAGTIEGPRVVAAGPAVTMTGGHIPYLGRVADGPEQLRAAVRANFAMGAGCIKVVATGGVLTKGLDPRLASYTQPELDALVDEAHRLGLPVAAHAIGEGGVTAALRAGADSIEHGMFLDDESIELFLETGARYSATFAAREWIMRGESVPRWAKERARPAAEAHVPSFQAAVKAGVRIVAGTDAGTPENYHGRVAHEVVSMVEAGLDPLAGVRAATAEGADLLGEPDRGVLRAGAVADVLAAAGDVAADISALTRPAAVFQSGRRVR